MTKSDNSKPLEYIGGGAWLPGVPARDLTADEAAQFDRQELIKSGLYREPRMEVTHGRSEEAPQDPAGA